MKWEPKKVYLYLVSLVTFIMVLIGSYNLVSRLVEVVLPTEDYYACVVPKSTDGTTQTQEEQQRCEEDRRRSQANQRIYLQRGLVQNSIFLLITVPAYLYHWRTARKLDE